ncbi:MAG: metal ABC transporter solute-binding protein, Zn/Mn family [Pseudonocardia sp.]
MRPLRALLLMAAATLLIAGCGATEQASPPAAAPGPTVVASTNVYGAIARAVGGERITVMSVITDPAADPHSYESTPADAVEVARADLVVRNGGGYDDFMTRLVETAGGTPTVVDASEVSGLVADEKAGDEHADEHGHEHGAFNEHVWYSFPTVQKVADRIAAGLAALDPAGATGYTANARTFAEQVGQLEQKAAAIRTGAPGARVAVTEPLPGYLLQAAGLTDVTPPEFTEAVEEDTDPPAAAVAQTMALLQGPEKVRALVVNAQTATPTTQQIRAAADAGGVPVVEMTETLPEGQADYVSWMTGQVDALASAVGAPR